MTVSSVFYQAVSGLLNLAPVLLSGVLKALMMGKGVFSLADIQSSRTLGRVLPHPHVTQEGLVGHWAGRKDGNDRNRK